MAFARDLPNVVSPELVSFLGRRLDNEGVVSFAKGMNDVHDCLLRALTVGSNVLPPTYIPQGSLPDWVSQPAQALDFFGMFNKLQVQDQQTPAPWDSFKLRNLEVTNLDGAHWEEILPLPRGYHKWIHHEMGAAPTTVFCKHGPGATAERLSGWDKWLPFIQNKSGDQSIRMVDVPKDTKTRRIIGIEPVMRQFVQQGVSHALRHTKYFHKYIDLHNQRAHANFACGDELVTIDLKDASDRIPLSLLDYLLPSDWSHLIRATSTGYATLPCGEGLRLGMVATMGCGFCFEVETLLFHLVAGLISSSCLSTLANSLRSCRVYGDDLILASHWVPAWSHFCNQAGWVMSDKKTMLTPRFKETVGFWIVDGKPRQRYLPQLAGTSSSLTLSDADKLSLSSRAMLAGYGHLTSAIVADVILPIRWDKSLQHWEVKVRMSSHSRRVLTVTEETRWLAYWKCGLSDQSVEDLPTKEDHEVWVPMETHPVLGTVIDAMPSLPVTTDRVYTIRM
jgi:hypothetical protein